MIIKASRSGFKTSDQVQGPRLPAGFRLLFKKFDVLNKRRPIEKAQSRRRRIETTSNHIAAYRDAVRPNENKYCRTELKVIKSPFWGR